MKIKTLLIALAAMLLIGPAATFAAPDDEAKYTEAIEKRAADILGALGLSDEGKSTRVHDAIIAQYRALRDWQEKNDAAKKAKDTAKQDELKVQRKALHEQFLSKLSPELSMQQIDIVKDKLTYNKVKVTYDGYVQIVPGLTDAHKAKIMEFLRDAREEAMDGVSAEEKSAIFKKYKGKINNYLSKEGIDVAKAYKDWGEAQKAKKARQTKDGNAPATNPSDANGN